MRENLKSLHFRERSWEGDVEAMRKFVDRLIALIPRDGGMIYLQAPLRKLVPYLSMNSWVIREI